MRSSLIRLQLLVVIVVLVPLTLGPSPALLTIQPTSAQTTALAAHGCTIDPRKPDIKNGNLIARATVACTTDMEGRVVVTELQQRRASGSYNLVPGSRIYYDVAENTEGTDPADGVLVRCRKVSGTRKFKSVTKIHSGDGNYLSVASNWAEFPRDCVDDDSPVIPINPGTDGEEISAEESEGGGSVNYRSGRAYQCSIQSYDPTQEGSYVVALGRFDCSDEMPLRFIYVQPCHDMTALVLSDECGDPKYKKLKKARVKWVSTRCLLGNPGEVPGRLADVSATYTRAGINPQISGARDRYLLSRDVVISNNNKVCTEIPTWLAFHGGG